MAKLAFSKLNKIKNWEPITVNHMNNELIIKQYLPLADKVQLITNVIEQSGDEVGFFNIVKLEAFYRIEMVKAYTNISFTEKQLEDPTKLYDALILNDIWSLIEDNIPQIERKYIWNNILELAKEITTYSSSVLGILKAISQDYDNISLDINALVNKLTNPEALAVAKELAPFVQMA